MTSLPAPLPEASIIDLASDPAAYVIAACERAKAWLVDVLDHGRIEEIVELKSQAEAIRVYTMQKQLGKDAELSAAEIVRRAERGIGLAIRKGQTEGKIRKQGQHGEVSSGGTNSSPGAHFPGGSKERVDSYAMTDSITDERFESAIAKAKTEKNLSRANVVRKIHGGNGRATLFGKIDEIRALASGGHSSRQIAEKVGVTEYYLRSFARKAKIDIPADKAIGRARKLDSNRIVREIVTGLEAVETSAALVDFKQLGSAECVGWARSLHRSMRVLAQLLRRLEGRRNG